MASSIHWLFGASGDWTNNRSDWSGGQALGASDNVTIAAAGTYTVDISTTTGANSLTIDATGATVNDTGAFAIGSAQVVQAGTFESSGSIIGGIFSSAGGTVLWQGGTLSGVTYEGTLDLSPANSTLAIAVSLTATGVGDSGPGAINLTGNGSKLFFEGNITLDSATIDLGSASTANDEVYYYDINGSGSVLTLGPNLIISQNGGRDDLGSLSGDSQPVDGIVNDGTIKAEASGGNFTINPTNFTNNGTITVPNGDTLYLEAASWSNSGTITVAARSTLHLGGDFTNAQLAGIINDGDTIDLTHVASAGGGTAVVSDGVLDIKVDGKSYALSLGTPSTFPADRLFSAAIAAAAPT